MITLQSWFGAKKWAALPVAKAAAGFLQDFHSSPAILDYKASHIACCALSLAFQTYGVQVPLTDEFDENTVWYSVSIHISLFNEKHRIDECHLCLYSLDFLQRLVQGSALGDRREDDRSVRLRTGTRPVDTTLLRWSHVINDQS